MSIEHRQVKQALIALGVLLTVATAATLNYRMVGGRRTRAQALRAELTTGAGGAEKLIALSATIPELEDAMADLGKAIPASADLGGLIEQLSAGLEAESIEAPSIQVQTPLSGGSVDRLPIGLQFRAPFDAFFRLLKRLETNQRLMRVDRVVIARSSAAASGDLHITIDLSTFSQTLPEGAP